MFLQTLGFVLVCDLSNIKGFGSVSVCDYKRFRFVSVSDFFHKGFTFVSVCDFTHIRGYRPLRNSQIVG